MGGETKETGTVTVTVTVMAMVRYHVRAHWALAPGRTWPGRGEKRPECPMQSGNPRSLRVILHSTGTYIILMPRTAKHHDTS